MRALLSTDLIYCVGRAVLLLGGASVIGLAAYFIAPSESGRITIWCDSRPSCYAGRVIQASQPKFEFIEDRASHPGQHPSEILRGSACGNSPCDLAWVTLDQLPIVAANGYRAIMLLGWNAGVDILPAKLPIEDKESLSGSRIVFPEYGPGRWLLHLTLSGANLPWPGDQFWKPAAGVDDAAQQFIPNLGQIQGAVLWGAMNPRFKYDGEFARDPLPEFLVARAGLMNERAGDLQILFNAWLPDKKGPPNRVDAALEHISTWNADGGKVRDTAAAFRLFEMNPDTEVTPFEIATKDDNIRMFDRDSEVYRGAAIDYSAAKEFYGGLKIPGLALANGDLRAAMDGHLIPHTASNLNCPGAQSLTHEWFPSVYFEPGSYIPNDAWQQAFENDVRHYLTDHGSASARFCIEGFADDKGEFKNNKELSLHRGIWVQQYLAGSHPAIKLLLTGPEGKGPYYNSNDPDAKFDETYRKKNRKAVLYRAK